MELLSPQINTPMVLVMKEEKHIQLFYSREDYVNAVRDAGTFNMKLGLLFGSVFMFFLWVLAGYFVS